MIKPDRSGPLARTFGDASVGESAERQGPCGVGRCNIDETTRKVKPLFLPTLDFIHRSEPLPGSALVPWRSRIPDTLVSAQALQIHFTDDAAGAGGPIRVLLKILDQPAEGRWGVHIVPLG